MTEAIVGLR